MHHHHEDGSGLSAEMGLGGVVFESLATLVLLAAAVGYAIGLWVNRHRSPWPWHRSVLWLAGILLVGAGLIGPLARTAHESFTAHMLGHLLIGMLGPLCLVLGAPVTLALRALPVATARSLSRLLGTVVVRVLVHPVITAVLNAGGLWLLYTTDLFHLMHTSALIHGIVHAHVVLVGYLFTASMIGADPDPHRASMRLRAVVLIVFIAAHSVLAKYLYVVPPDGVDVGDAQIGAQLMYYGGDVVDIAVTVLLFLGWYRRSRPRSLSAPTCTTVTG